MAPRQSRRYPKTLDFEKSVSRSPHYWWSSTDHPTQRPRTLNPADSDQAARPRPERNSRPAPDLPIPVRKVLLIFEIDKPERNPTTVSFGRRPPMACNRQTTTTPHTIVISQLIAYRTCPSRKHLEARQQTFRQLILSSRLLKKKLIFAEVVNPILIWQAAHKKGPSAAADGPLG